MIIVFVFFILLFFINCKFYIKSFNQNYLDKNNTIRVNGMFVMIIFFSHFYSYVDAKQFLDLKLLDILNMLGQLMVTTFLFFSGYGIFESIKKKSDYMKNFFKKRFLTTLINFDIVILIFFFLNIIIKKETSLAKLVLALIGWESLGNSNWYMMTIFILYIFTMMFLKKQKQYKKSIILLSVFSIIYIIIISKFKEKYWCNTMLCFSAGMWYSYYKEKIDFYMLKNNRNYIVILIINTLALGFFYIINLLTKYNIYIYNLFSIIFVLEIVCFLVKLQLSSKIFEYLGKRVFWIYILQRIPMILLQNKITNIYTYFGICLLVTLIFAETMYRITKIFWDKVN